MNLALSLSGLNGASKALDVISNNIANSQTIGFKSSKVRFADVYAASAFSTLNGAPSAGTSAAVINQQFSQGGIIQTENPLDMAITGQGFFRLSKGSEISYSRDGQFQLSYDPATPDIRVLVNRAGLGVTGYPADYTADPRGVITTTGTPQNISFGLSMPAAATTQVSLGATLDSRSAAPAVAPFDSGNRLSYTDTTAVAVFDSTGASHELRMYFAKSAPGNLWDLYTTLDGGAQAGPVAVSFDTHGVMTTAMPLAAQSYAVPGGESLSIALNLGGTTTYGRGFVVDATAQDGYSTGTIVTSGGVRVGSDGMVQGLFTNGQSRKLAQIALANFVNPNALISMGDNQWTENADPVKGTGTVILDTPGRTTGDKPMGLGAITGAAKELSNVDLGNELVAMIEQQRNYQASAQTLKIQDQILQNLANLR